MRGDSVKLLPVMPPPATTLDRVIETVPEVVDKVTDFIEKQQEKKAQETERADFAEDLAKASGAIKELWGCTKLNLGSFGDTNPHLHFHIVPKYEGGFEFGGAFAITNPEPVYLTDGEYQEMISALKAKLGI